MKLITIAGNGVLTLGLGKIQGMLLRADW